MTKQKLLELCARFGCKAGRNRSKADVLEILTDHMATTLGALQRDVEHHEMHRKAYFWTPPTSADNRRNEEKLKSYTHKLTVDGTRYEYESKVTCSCKNYYYDGAFYVDGTKRTLSQWRHLLQKVERNLILIQKYALSLSDK